MYHISLRINHNHATVMQRFFHQHIMLRLSKTGINLFQENFNIALTHNSLLFQI